MKATKSLNDGHSLNRYRRRGMARHALDIIGRITNPTGAYVDAPLRSPS